MRLLASLLFASTALNAASYYQPQHYHQPQANYYQSQTSYYPSQDDGYGDNSYGYGNNGDDNSVMNRLGDKLMNLAARLMGQEVATTICYAINNQKQIELLIENQEIINPKEMRTIIKKVVVEPYALGTKDSVPILQGKIVKEENIREVNVKVNEDLFKNRELLEQTKEERRVVGRAGLDLTRKMETGLI